MLARTRLIYRAAFDPSSLPTDELYRTEHKVGGILHQRGRVFVMITINHRRIVISHDFQLLVVHGVHRLSAVPATPVVRLLVAHRAHESQFVYKIDFADKCKWGMWLSHNEVT